MDLSRETCVVRLFQLDNDAPLGLVSILAAADY